MVASCTDALETGSVLAVVKRGVDRDFRVWTLGVGARKNDVALVEVPVAKQATGASLSFTVELGSLSTQRRSPSGTCR